MRLFIAAGINDKVWAAASGLIDELSKAKGEVKWVEPGNLHLTLVFLGEVSADHLTPITNALDSTANGNGAFEIEFDRLGAFGAPSRPRVIWLGIGKGAKVLTTIAADLRRSLEANGVTFSDEHEFSAHLTLGRVRGPRGVKELVERLRATPVSAGLSLRVENLMLFQSRLAADGPKYAVLRESALEM